MNKRKFYTLRLINGKATNIFEGYVDDTDEAIQAAADAVDNKRGELLFNGILFDEDIYNMIASGADGLNAS